MIPDDFDAVRCGIQLDLAEDLGVFDPDVLATLRRLVADEEDRRVYASPYLADLNSISAKDRYDMMYRQWTPG